MTQQGFEFRIANDKKIGHKYPPGVYNARILRSRINRAGNVELVLTDLQKVETEKTSS